jgi:YYY domain-containing protein
LALRVWNINFDWGLGSHPDERSTACFYAPSMQLPQSWDEFWDPHRSPLNPLWDLGRQEPRKFTYGHFPLYLGVVMGELFHVASPVAELLGAPHSTVELMARANGACDGVAVAGRLTIALLDTVTIYLLYLLGRRVYGRPAGLLAAAMYAFAAQAVQLSHFFAMDPASTTFTVLAVLGGVLFVQERSLRTIVVMGAGAGLAMASKFSALPILAVPAVAAGLTLWQERQKEVGGKQPNGGAQLMALLAAPLAWLLAAAVFFIASPYAVLDWGTFVQATLIEQGQMVRGVADFPFTRQYRNTTPYLYFIMQQMQWGLGWPLGVVAFGGALYMLVRAVGAVAAILRSLLSARAANGIRLPNYALANLVVWSWVVPYFGLTGGFLAKFNRYMSPLLPFLAFFAAATIWHLWQTRRAQHAEDGEDEPVARRPGRLTMLGRSLAALIAIIAVGGGLLWSVAYVNGVYGHEHPWITASRWTYQNVPRGSTILWELWDDPLPKTIPGEAGMDMGTAGLRNSDWGPYEEDTFEKYQVLKEKLREADYVAYSSKRIYESVDELPERYPMTNLYYQAMWDGRLGFELALDLTSPPRLFGKVFEDRTADESWSLYDHPQVTIFRKTRDLTDAEMDALFAGTWETAIPYYRGKESALSPVLEAIGLGSRPESEHSGLIAKVISLMSPVERAPGPNGLPPADEPSLLLDRPLAELPLVDNYRWNDAASNSPGLAIGIWWLAISLIGWLCWPLLFWLLRPLRDRGYLFSRTAGWLLASWLLWIPANTGLLYNTVRNVWLAVIVLGVLGILAGVRQRTDLGQFLRQRWGLLLIGEGVFAVAYLGFVLVRMANPDIWQPWFGGEKFMEFAFLNGILRSPTFPPVDPHFAGGQINYYYFGLYMVAFLIKMTGVYAEVAFNLAIPTLFALTVLNAYGLVYSAWGWTARSVRWHQGVATALLGPLFVTLLGNLDGFAQVVRNLAQQSNVEIQSIFPLVGTLAPALARVPALIRGEAALPAYDFWGPSRVIPNTINEFPYWSFLFADLHPHLIGIPLALLALAIVLAYLGTETLEAAASWRRAVLLAAYAFLLGALASVNLWEAPTYLGIGVLAYLTGAFLGQANGRVRLPWLRAVVVAAALGLGAYVTFSPFFLRYVNVGASGVGLVRTPDDWGAWLLIWGLPAYVLTTWVLVALASSRTQRRVGNLPTGLERAAGMVLRHFDRLPRLVKLHSLLVQGARPAYLAGIVVTLAFVVAAIVALAFGWTVLAFCLLVLAPAWTLLWRTGASHKRDPAVGHDAGESETAQEQSALWPAARVFLALLTTTGLAILAGTQIVYLKDFLQGGDWYRMNTLFKFFSQVWVLWGVATAVALPQLWRRLAAADRPRQAAAVTSDVVESDAVADVQRAYRGHSAPASLSWSWTAVFVLLLAASMAYPLWGTPARLSQRLVGWRPPFGTLNGLDYMRNGSYTWPDDSHRIELQYDWEAIQWLLANVRGNPVVAESAEVDYYRAGGTRVASLTGISGLRGMHESEQRAGEAVGERDGLHREFWNTQDETRTKELIDQLQISLIYVGELERHQHPDGVQKLERMAQRRQLEKLYSNAGVTIYGVPGTLARSESGYLVPVAQDAGVEDVGLAGS